MFDPNVLKEATDRDLTGEIVERASKGTLDETAKSEMMAVLIILGTIAEGARAEVQGTLSGTPASEAVAENPALADYKAQYYNLPGNVKARLDWKTIAERLLANDGEKLKKAKDMQGGGQLFGVDKNGLALFKDKGVEPVMYGFDEENKLMKIYDRNPEQMKKVKRWANYFEVRKQVIAAGYELFTHDRSYNFGDEMQQAVNHTEEPFVASKDGKTWRMSWLESGDKPQDKLVQYAFFNPDHKYVNIASFFPLHPVANYGAVHLLRV